MYDFVALPPGRRRPESSEPPRLRDFVAGLRSGEMTAEAIINRLDPDLADEINAVALHRGVTTEAFIAGALIVFALDAADEAWRRLGERSGASPADAEAGAFGALLADAVRRAEQRDERIASAGPTDERTATPGRRVLVDEG